MTPAPFDLPLRPAEAAGLAQLIFEQAERKPLTDEIRNRLAARTGLLRLESITPWFGSLVRDPVHPSTYYFAADGQDGRSWLFHLATAAAPASGTFPKALLIGRMRAAGSEIVINAVPFGPTDQENLARFVERLDPAFAPKAQGSRMAIAIAAQQPDRDLPAAFEAYRAVLKRTGRNLAYIAAGCWGRAAREVYLAALWSAIRAGWREGYSIGIEISADGESLAAAEEAIRWAAAFSSFVLRIPDLPGSGREMVAQLYQTIREVKTARRTGKAFDVEVSPDGLSAEDLASCLEWWKRRGIPCQVHGSRLLGTAHSPDQIASLGGTMSKTVI